MRKQPHEALTKFGHNLRKIREEKNWTQETLADLAGVDQTFISGIERGTRNPTIITIAKIAKALHVKVSTLCEGIEG